MPANDAEPLQNTIVKELDVLEDDIHVSKDTNALTFYLPPDQLDRAREVIDGDVEVLEEYENEYLVKTTF